ncbi:MAG: hypothetical protein CENE_02187 [Candidatus Celerinatantimonas neptuna]|nr:MAG: hypothetical protein CENE_02187 [Candidatus Celerinatantimonas neptuna]
MTAEQLKKILALTDEQFEQLQVIEQNYTESMDSLFAEDLSARQMLRKLRQLTLFKHNQISELLNPTQKKFYLSLLEEEHHQSKTQLK